MSFNPTTAFRDFAAGQDLASLSHQGLNRELIPRWLQEDQGGLTERIEDSAYGETPPGLAEEILDLLHLGVDDRFLDLGSGAGNLCLYALSRCQNVNGMERNPRLWEASQSLLKGLELDSTNLLLGDFLEQDWPQANKLYATTARFTEATMARLSERVEKSSASAVATLGRPLELGPQWEVTHSSERRLLWNAGEQPMREQLTVSVRS